MLLKLVRELEAGLRRKVGHGLLERVEAALAQSLSVLQHAHVLISSLELLLLLLQQLDLLRNGQLFHCEEKHMLAWLFVA